ncbi:MAG: hypothetical protein ACTSRZ_17955 [Promethearchaeota archaeon]
MTQKINFMNMIYLIGFILLVLLVAIWFINLRANFREFKETEEGECFIKIAKNYCKENGMDFKKLYVKGYGDYEFACLERGSHRGYDFTREEKLKCGNYYGTN